MLSALIAVSFAVCLSANLRVWRFAWQLRFELDFGPNRLIDQARQQPDFYDAYAWSLCDFFITPW